MQTEGARSKSQRRPVKREGLSVYTPVGHISMRFPLKGLSRGPSLEPAKIGPVGVLHGPQVAVAGKVLIVSPAAVAVNTTIHLMLDERTQVLIPVGPFLSQITPDPVAAGDGQILQQAVPAFIADRAIVGMVHHEPLDHLPAEIDRFAMGSRNHHPILCLHHTTHLHAFDGAFREHDRADAASPHGPQRRVLAEARDHDAQPFGRFDDLCPLGDFNGMTINDEFGHRDKSSFQLSAFSFQQIRFSSLADR